MRASKILDLTVGDYPEETETIREYLRRTLIALVEEGDNFSGKRPLGDSDWDYQIYKAMIRGGAIEGVLDGEGDIENFDEFAARKLLIKIIKKL